MHLRLLSRPSRHDGFTLIELLTVIAIIGVLVAIIIPVVGKMRESAHGATCVSNLRQLHTAVTTYAQSNRGVTPYAYSGDDAQMVTPGASSWMNLLTGVTDGGAVFASSYLPVEKNYRMHSSIIGCPMQRRQISDSPTWTALQQNTYCMNGMVGRIRLETVRQPTKTMLITDGRKASATKYDVAIYPNAYGPQAAHGTKANIVYCDGHVGSRVASSIPVSPATNSPDYVLWYP